MSGHSLVRQLASQVQPDLPDEAGDLQGVANQLANEISNESYEIERLCGIAGGLEDLVAAVESIEEPTPAHLLLLEAGLNMSYAGTSMRSDDLSPALESHDHLQVSMEGVKERVKQIIEMIRRFLTTLWEKIAQFAQATVGEIARLRMRLETLDIRCDEIDGRSPVHQQIRLGQNVYGLATDRGVPQDAYVFGKNLDTLTHVLQGMREFYVPTVIKIGGGFHQALHDFRPQTEEAAIAWLERLNHIASAYDVTAFTSHIGHFSGVVDARYTPGVALGSASLPGNRSVVFVDGRKIFADKINGSVLDRAVALQASSGDLIRMHVTKTVDPNKAVMRTLTPEEIRQILKHAQSLLAELETGVNSRLKIDLIRSAKDLTAVTKDSGTHAHAFLPYYNRGMAYCTSYGVWSSRPYVQLVSHSLVVIRATLGACSRQLAAYHRSE